MSSKQDEARKVHAVVRTVLDGICPNCRRSSILRTFKSFGTGCNAYVCNSCSFFVSLEDVDAALKEYEPLAGQMTAFLKWREERRAKEVEAGQEKITKMFREAWDALHTKPEKHNGLSINDYVRVLDSAVTRQYGTAGLQGTIVGFYEDGCHSALVRIGGNDYQLNYNLLQRIPPRTQEEKNKQFAAAYGKVDIVVDKATEPDVAANSVWAASYQSFKQLVDPPKTEVEPSKELHEGWILWGAPELIAALRKSPKPPTGTAEALVYSIARSHNPTAAEVLAKATSDQLDRRAAEQTAAPIDARYKRFYEAAKKVSDRWRTHGGIDTTGPLAVELREALAALK